MYDHIVATKKVYIDGALAFDVGHPIPVETARRIGIKGQVVKGDESKRDDFTDDAIHVSTRTAEDGTTDLVPEEPGTDTGKPKE